VQHQVFDYNSVMLKSKFSSQGQLIYIILICSLLIVIASTYFLKTTISTTQLLFTKTRHKCQIHATIKGLTFYLMLGGVEVIVALARIHKTIIKKNLKGELSWCFLCENVFRNRYMRF
jgi:hypothetical protein